MNGLNRIQFGVGIGRDRGWMMKMASWEEQTGGTTRTTQLGIHVKHTSGEGTRRINSLPNLA